MKKCTIVYNPHTPRLQDGKIVQLIEERLLDTYGRVEVLKSEFPGHLIRLVKDSDGKTDLILSVGGDGTFNEVVQGIFSLKKQCTPVAHIPAGTTNDLGKTFGLPTQPLKALDKILSGRTASIDYLLLNGKPFSYIAAFGYLSGVPAETPNWLKQAFGRNGYLIRGIRRFFRDPAKYEIIYEIDGVTYRDYCMFGIVTNAKGFGGLDVFDMQVKLNDGKFEFLYVKSVSKRKFLELINKVLINRRKLENCEETKMFVVSKLHIKCQRSSFRTWSLDGDAYKIKGHEALIEVAPQQLLVQLPEDTILEMCKK